MTILELPIGTEVDELGDLFKGGFAQDRLSSDSRSSRLSTLERRIIKDSDQCPQCVANDDPRNVPVHPNCHCSVITDSVEYGVADSENRFLSSVLSADEVVTYGDVVLEDSGIQLNPETVAILDAENVRWGDLARWLEQMQPYLEVTDQYISIIVDDDTDEALAQVEEAVSTVIDDSEQLTEAIRNKKLWFAIAKAVAL